LNSNGLESPRLRSVKAFYPRASYLRYLPAVYQEDEESRQFLERFLSIFQSEFDAFDRRIDRLWQLFNPDSVPKKNLTWLAAWLGYVLNLEWPENKQRAMLRTAFKKYFLRGTVAGLKQSIRDHVGVEANVIEHFRLRRWPVLPAGASLSGGVRLWSPDFYQRLQVTSYSQIGRFRLLSRPEPPVEPFDWGAYQFTVLFVADPYRAEDVQHKVTQVVEREKPAHTQATICPVFPRFRIGVQSTVGTDSVVAGISHLVLGQLATLGYDSILSASPEEKKLRSLGLTSNPQLGRSSQLS
jgi:phage tail-like protein